MKILAISAVCLFSCLSLFAQNSKQDMLRNAQQLYQQHQYQDAFPLYCKALNMRDTGKTEAENYCYAAEAAANIHQNDSAFSWLYKYADSTEYPQVVYVKLVTDFDNLYSDNRWNPYINYLQQKQDKYDSLHHYNLALKKELDQMWYDDQWSRYRLDVYAKKYGNNSKQLDSLWNMIGDKDSLNLIKLENIFAKYGWVSKAEVGNNRVQWMVVQHSDLKTQEKYLPLLKEAVAKKELPADYLALTIDRVNLGEGKKQIYGSQITQSSKHPAFVAPLEDPDNVDKRREEVGLEPIADYVKKYDIIWNVEEYKKMLPTYELWEKEAE